MERLWAPWRLAYIRRPKKQSGCIFCKAKRSRSDRKSLVVYRSTHSFVVLNLFPYTNGHLMIVPNRHVAALEKLTEAERTNIFSVVIQMEKLLKKLLKPDGFNVGFNIGEAAGAGIKNHLHMHVVPRWKGDTNFMPVLGNTKVISQSLDHLYESLTHVIKRGIRRKRR